MRERAHARRARRSEAGQQAAPCGRATLTSWSHHVQLLMTLAPEAHHQAAKAGESGGIAGKRRSQPGACGVEVRQAASTKRGV